MVVWFVVCSRSSPLIAECGSPTGMMLVHYDIKMSGEAKTYPHIRTTPFSEKIENAYKIMVGGFLTAAADPTATTAAHEKPPLTPGTMAMVIGNQKPGLKRQLLAP